MIVDFRLAAVILLAVKMGTKYTSLVKTVPEIGDYLLDEAHCNKLYPQLSVYKA